MDVKKLIRLKHTVIAAADGLPEAQEAVAGTAYANTFNSLRSEVRASLPEHLLEEFDRLFGELSARHRGGSDLFGQAGVANDARLRLRSMVGWLEGVIQAEATGN